MYSQILLTNIYLSWFILVAKSVQFLIPQNISLHFKGDNTGLDAKVMENNTVLMFPTPS